VATRETAAVLCLMERRDLPWNRLAGLIEGAGSALALLKRLDEETPRPLFDERPEVGPLDAMQTHVESWEAEGIHVISVMDDAYPENLRTVHDRPPLLFVRGHLEARDQRSVAVVGTRSATDEGLRRAAMVARGLAEAGYVVVSGLAEGVDSAAHRATIEAGGRTIAVIGTGHHHYFPKSNAELQRHLSAASAVVSQFLPDQGPRRWSFPQRNAVMSGFARATVVIEASHTSGAKMQARLALEHGRPVFLLRSLLEHSWARDYAERAGTRVVDDAGDVVEHLDRLYSGKLTPAP
jgi:DNA processing protein